MRTWMILALLALPVTAQAVCVNRNPVVVAPYAVSVAAGACTDFSIVVRDADSCECEEADMFVTSNSGGVGLSPLMSVPQGYHDGEPGEDHTVNVRACGRDAGRWVAWVQATHQVGYVDDRFVGTAKVYIVVK